MTADFEVREVKTLDEFFAIEEIQRDAWGFADKELVPQSILLAIGNASGLVLGGFLPDGTMGGFAFSFLAGQEGEYHHHSHMSAVLRRHRGTGLALAIKREQRIQVLGRGLDRITWTYDPIEARNAAFNMRKLGVVADRYLEDVYGLSSGPVHGGLPTDRIAVTWNLKSAKVRRLAGDDPAPAEPPPEDARAFNRTEVDDDGRRKPTAWEWDAAETPALVEIPSDIQALKLEARPLAKAWRMHIREGLGRLFEEGYRINGFHLTDDAERRAFYRLTKVAAGRR